MHNRRRRLKIKTIYLIRHCQAAGQEPLAPLTNKGRDQADQLIKFFEQIPIDYIVSSPYERAVSSIRPLADKLSIPLHIDDRLRERVLSTENMPNWMEALKETYRDMNKTFPGGESSNVATKRGISVIHELSVRPEKHVAVVTHGNIMSLILHYFRKDFGFEQWKQLSNPDVYKLTVLEASVNRIWKESHQD